MAAEYATPMEAMNRLHRNTEQVANMSRSRYISYLLVTVLVAVLTCFTVLIVTLMQNVELQNRFLHWGDAASCFVNTTDLTKKDPEAAIQKINWLELLLRFLNHCVLNNGTVPGP